MRAGAIGESGSTAIATFGADETRRPRMLAVVMTYYVVEACGCIACHISNGERR